MVEDEVALVELRLGRTREEHKRGALWGMQGSGQDLKIENLFLRVLLCWMVAVLLSSTALVTS
jgi:hypothetical protein